MGVCGGRGLCGCPRWPECHRPLIRFSSNQPTTTMKETTMSDLISGEFEGRAVKTEFGANSKTSKPEVRVEMEVVGGPHAGKRFPYNGKLDDKSIKWTKMRMMAIGWAGNDVRTFSDDVA